jgi:hypothetical protein
MTAMATEAWARRGAAEDMVLLARLVACLDSSSRETLRQACTHATEPHRAGTPAARPGNGCIDVSGDLVFVIDMLAGYNALQDHDKASVLSTAVELIATTRLRSSKALSTAWVDEDEWLRCLAEDTYPDIGDVADLVDLAKQVEPDWDDVMFPDGPHALVVAPSEHGIGLADGLLVGYETIRGSVGAADRPPPPADFLGVDVPKGAFKEWNGDGWTLDEDRWKTAVRDATVLRFAELIAEWRTRFFEALTSGREPQAR